MTDSLPKFENSPGVVVRLRPREGVFAAWWQARSDLVKRGFRPALLPLWRGIEPTESDRQYISDTCTAMQNEMIAWGRGGFAASPIGVYDGTIRTLIDCYKTDEDSPFQALRYHSKINYSYFLKYIAEDHGSVRIKDMDARMVKKWHKEWLGRGVVMAHGMVGHLRGALTFGSTFLKCKDCREIRGVMRDMKFKQGAARDVVLTADMADAIRAEAHRQGLHSIALAQAIQFEGMLRQKDIIGSWEPMSEPGPADITYTDTRGIQMKWLRGIRWSEIDADLVLRHVTSKRQKEVEIRLGEAPMFRAEMERLGELPKFGPVIVCETTGRPYVHTQFRQMWRRLADACGIPKNIRNADSRAGAITEATEADVPLEHIKHAACHSDIQQTQQYSRNRAEKTASTNRARWESRKNKSGTSV